MHEAFAANHRVSKSAVRTNRGIVTAQNSKAAKVGAEILASGGNAVDAAIATSFALGATEPWMSGIGGGGVMLIYDKAADRVQGIDFAMRAPLATDPADYPLTGTSGADLFGWPQVKGDRNLIGPLSMAVPGYLGGIGLAAEQFGSMPISELIGPALSLAIEGLEVDWFAALVMATAARGLDQFASSRAIYLPDGHSLVPDWGGHASHLSLGQLVETLNIVAAEGCRSLYEGTLARSFVRDVQDVGGRIGSEDLQKYQANLVDPIAINYGDARIWAMPGLTGGVTLRQILKQVAEHSFTGDWPDEHAFSAYVDAIRISFADRLETLGDSGDAGQSSCTSHISVIDADGNLVSLTQTLLSLFGSKVVLPETGILMNNGMMWFDPRPGRPNSIAAGKKPLANMCPIIAMDADHRLALGASGGRRIIPAVQQVLSFLFDYEMGLEEALAQPRIDVAGDGSVTVNQALWDPIPGYLIDKYQARLLPSVPYPSNFATPLAVMHDSRDSMNYGATEPVHPWADAVVSPDSKN